MLMHQTKALLAVAGALTFAVTIALSGAGPASATTTKEARERSVQIVDFVQTAEQQEPSRVRDQALSDRLIAAAASRSGTRAGVRADLDRAEAMAVSSSYVVRIPLQGDDLEAMSSRSVVFDSPTQVAGTIDYEFRGDGEGGGSLTVLHDGEQVWSQSISADQADRAAAGAGEELRGAGNFWQRLNSCLANQGIAAWMLALIAAACGAVCFFTAGLGCVACIGATIGFPSGVIGACVAYANK